MLPLTRISLSEGLPVPVILRRIWGRGVKGDIPFCLGRGMMPKPRCAFPLQPTTPRSRALHSLQRTRRKELPQTPCWKANKSPPSPSKTSCCGLSVWPPSTSRQPTTKTRTQSASSSPNTSRQSTAQKLCLGPSPG